MRACVRACKTDIQVLLDRCQLIWQWCDISEKHSLTCSTALPSSICIRLVILVVIIGHAVDLHEELLQDILTLSALPFPSYCAPCHDGL